MKLAYVTWVFPALSQTFVDNQILALKRAGWEVAILRMRPGRDAVQSETSRSLSGDVLDEPCLWRPRFWEALLRLLLVRPLAIGRSLLLLCEWIWWPGALARLLYLLPRVLYFAEQCRRRGIEHVHADFLGLHVVAASMIAKIANISYRVRARTPKEGHFAHWLRYQFEELGFIACDSHVTRGVLVSQMPSTVHTRVIVIRQAADLDRFAQIPIPADGRDLIVSIARLSPGKGIEYLVKAVHLLQRAGRKISCVIVGGGPEQSRLCSMIERLALQNVSLVGPKPYESVIDFYEAAGIVAVPSTTVTRNGRVLEEEGLPTVVLEAMAAGWPVVATNVAAIPEAVLDGETGYVVPQRNPQALADALSRLLDSPSLRQRMGERARAYVRSEFDLERSTELLMGMIEHTGASHAHSLCQSSRNGGKGVQP